jgi:hypothetical protein
MTKKLGMFIRSGLWGLGPAQSETGEKGEGTMMRWLSVCCVMAVAAGLMACGGSDNEKDVTRISAESVALYVAQGRTTEGVTDRVLLVDTRSSGDYFEGHIEDALNVPYSMISENGDALYTNGYDTVSTTASDQLADSWLAHMLINQLVNDFSSTYEDSILVFYGDDGCEAAALARSVGYSRSACLEMDVDDFSTSYAGLVSTYAPGVISVDEAGGSFVFTGVVNNVNYANVSTRATHHGITYKGGGLSASSFIQADLPPFCFQEMLSRLGADPDGNMADGIVYGDMSVWQSKYPDGDKVIFEISWEGADRYYTLDEVFEEKASEFDTDAASFSPVGIEPRIGGTRDSNLLWNPGCIFCFYACVCGITSNATANEDTWFADGGTYDGTVADTNYYAGRFYPKRDLLPGEGETLYIRASIDTSHIWGD